MGKDERLEQTAEQLTEMKDFDTGNGHWIDALSAHNGVDRGTGKSETAHIGVIGCGRAHVTSISLADYARGRKDYNSLEPIRTFEDERVVDTKVANWLGKNCLYEAMRDGLPVLYINTEVSLEDVFGDMASLLQVSKNIGLDTESVSHGFLDLSEGCPIRVNFDGLVIGQLVNDTHLSNFPVGKSILGNKLSHAMDLLLNNITRQVDSGATPKKQPTYHERKKNLRFLGKNKR